MTSSLYDAMLVDAKIRSTDELNEQQKIWFEYAVSSNERGATLVNTFEDNFTGPLRGKRVLDIGCGFGGAAIAAARQGASVIGVDLSDKNLKIAQKNALDWPDLDLQFLNLDVTRRGADKYLDPFDLVIADNVIEHVGCPTSLIAAASRLLRHSGHLYVTAPNSRSTQMVRSECHYSMLGASLLNPKAAELILNADPAIPFLPYEVSFYLDFSQYVELFERYELKPTSLLPEVASDADIYKLKSEVEEIGGIIRAHPWGDAIREFVLEAAGRWQSEFAADIDFWSSNPASSRLAGRIMRDYGHALWYFVAIKQ